MFRYESDSNENGYVIANKKGDFDSKMQYLNTLETIKTKNNKEGFLLFIAQIEKKSLVRYLETIGQ